MAHHKQSILIFIIPFLLSACNATSPKSSVTSPENKSISNARSEALENFPSNKVYRWQSETSGISGFVTPLRTFKTVSGTHCRDFLETVSQNQILASSEGTACRTKDGKWVVVNQ